jgi:U11/U12 small nuclear ribonucleoprotein SNRNP25
LKRIISKQEEGAIEPRKISWKYIWRTYVLQYGNTRLSDDNARLGDLGVGKDSELVFNKIRREKWAQKS